MSDDILRVMATQPEKWWQSWEVQHRLPGIVPMPTLAGAMRTLHRDGLTDRRQRGYAAQPIVEWQINRKGLARVQN